MPLSNSNDRFNGVLSTLAIKAPCVAVAVVNITLSGEQTVNGVAVVSGDRVLVIAQTNAIDNGIYDASSSGWDRSADFDGNRDIVSGTFATVALAGVGRNPFYQITTANPIVIGTTEINFLLADGANVSIEITDLELANGLTSGDINTAYHPGNAFRYMTSAQITDVLTAAKTLDVTQAINNAVNSGYGAYIAGGYPVIADTIILDGGKSLLLNNNITVERLGNSTEPLFHLYGNANALVGTGQAEIRNELKDHPHGIVLVGVHPTDAGGTSDVPTRGYTVDGLKVFGPVGTVENGSPGIYIHSGARRLGGNTSVCYKGVLSNIEIRNCDVGLEFSSDANSHYVSGLYVTRWISAAIWFNAAYGNVIDGVMMEFAEIAMTPNNDKRYAIEFNKQNSGVETGTDSGYFADGAFDNSINGYAELTNGTGGNVNRNIALLRQNEDGSVQGNNDVHIMGTLSGGIGLLGNSTAETDVGTTNTIETVNGLIHNRARWRVHGHQKRKVDDGSGSIKYKDSTCWMSNHHSSVTATSTQGNFFSWDNIQDAGRVAVKIEIDYACKVDGTINTQAGNIIWVARLHANSTYTSSKIFDVSDALGGTRILELNITLAAGADSNSMKVTVGFLSGSTGTKWAIGWNAKLLTSSAGSNLDWDGDIKYL